MKLKYKAIITIFILALTLVSFQTILAVDLGGSLAGQIATKAGYDKATSETTFAENIGVIIKIVLSFVGVVFLALTVYAGYLWMTARGEEEQVKKAQKIITSAVIGLIITVGAYSITSFVVPQILEKTSGPGASVTPKYWCCEYKLDGKDVKTPVNTTEECTSICAGTTTIKTECVIKQEVCH